MYETGKLNGITVIYLIFAKAIVSVIKETHSLKEILKAEIHFYAKFMQY